MILECQCDTTPLTNLFCIDRLWSLVILTRVFFRTSGVLPHPISAISGPITTAPTRERPELLIASGCIQMTSWRRPVRWKRLVISSESYSNWFQMTSVSLNVQNYTGLLKFTEKDRVTEESFNYGSRFECFIFCQDICSRTCVIITIKRT